MDAGLSASVGKSCDGKDPFMGPTQRKRGVTMIVITLKHHVQSTELHESPHTPSRKCMTKTRKPIQPHMLCNDQSDLTLP